MNIAHTSAPYFSHVQSKNRFKAPFKDPLAPQFASPSSVTASKHSPATFGNRKSLMTGIALFFMTIMGMDAGAQVLDRKGQLYPITSTQQLDQNDTQPDQFSVYIFQKFRERLINAAKQEALTEDAVNELAADFSGEYNKRNKNKIKKGRYFASQPFIPSNLFQLFSKFNQNDGNPIDSLGNPLLSQKDAEAIDLIINSPKFVVSTLFTGESLGLMYNLLFTGNSKACQEGVGFDRFVNTVAMIKNDNKPTLHDIEKTKEDEDVQQLFRIFSLNNQGQDIDEIKLRPQALLTMVAIYGNQSDDGSLGRFGDRRSQVPGMYLRSNTNGQDFYQLENILSGLDFNGKPIDFSNVRTHSNTGYPYYPIYRNKFMYDIHSALEGGQALSFKRMQALLNTYTIKDGQAGDRGEFHTTQYYNQDQHVAISDLVRNGDEGNVTLSDYETLSLIRMGGLKSVRFYNLMPKEGTITVKNLVDIFYSKEDVESPDDIEELTYKKALKKLRGKPLIGSSYYLRGFISAMTGLSEKEVLKRAEGSGDAFLDLQVPDSRDRVMNIIEAQGMKTPICIKKGADGNLSVVNGYSVLPVFSLKETQQ